MGNLLTEEAFDDSQTRSRLPQTNNDDIFTEDPTLQNIDNLESDISPRRKNLPSEHQQPLENEHNQQKEVFSRLSASSSLDSESPIVSPNPRNSSSVLELVSFSFNLEFGA